MITLIIVDDHDLVREGIRRLIEDKKGIKVVAEGKSGEEAITLAKEYDPDVILMDVRMPGIGGLEATRKINRVYPDIKILNVTACSGDPYPSRLLEAGSSGFITKESDIDEIEHAIRVISAGQKYLSPAIAQQIALNKLNPDSSGNGPFSELSDREMQIAMMIVSCKKTQDISDALFLSPKTISTYRHRLFEKLKIQGDVELTLLAIKHGLLDPGETT